MLQAIPSNSGLVPWKRQKFLNRFLSVVLIIVILVAIGLLGYLLAAPKAGEGFTEFYVLGLEGKAENYAEELVVGEEARVIVGIINQEHKQISYQVQVTIDGNRNNEISPVVLVPGEKYEQEVGFTPTKVGEKQKVEFVLYKEDKPYRYLHLLIDVKVD